LLVWAVTAWRLYIVMVQRERDAEQARQTTQNKMAAFLDAAASGRLWTDRTHKTASETESKTDVPSANAAAVADEPTVRSVLISVISYVYVSCMLKIRCFRPWYWLCTRLLCCRIML